MPMRLSIMTLLTLAAVVPGEPSHAQIVLPQRGGTPDPSAPAQPGGVPISPHFVVRVCNQWQREIFVALTVRTGEPAATDWTIQGWWTVSPDQCNNITNSLWGRFYLYAEEKGPDVRRIWPDPEKARDIDVRLCVEYPGPFRRIQQDGITCDPRFLKTFWAQDNPPSPHPAFTVTIK